MLEQFADPRALLAAGAAELTRLITSASGHQQGTERALQWRAAAAAAIDLYGDHPAVPFEELAAEVATEVRLLRAIGAELAVHAAAREQHYRQVDPAQLARSLPGFAEISAPVLVAIMGRPGRFRNGTKFKSYAGLAPKASETGETDTVNALDRDQIIIDDVHHPVLADPQPVIAATVEGFRRVRVGS